MDINDIPPSMNLYLKVRAGFVAQGSSLGAWCREQRIERTNVRSALIGAWNGPKGRKIRQRAIRDSGVLNIELSCA